MFQPGDEPLLLLTLIVVPEPQHPPAPANANLITRYAYWSATCSTGSQAAIRSFCHCYDQIISHNIYENKISNHVIIVSF